ncbi:MAG TPA: 2-amino-4-hydroxy-6-hydroxymethyldihydropteridine diphosphokinase [Allosphingosinicella sp.]|jgi:2-amino-4-hydroxy-6-hydroxymethyldihydropteridine diphosphokinase
MARTSYAIALGSNRPHGRHGRPEGVIRAAAAALGELGTVDLLSSIHRTAALGPAGRSFANAAAILTTDLAPPALLAALKGLEARFGRRRGRRWGARVLDLDIILWSEGRYEDGRLKIPHAEMARRPFVLRPLLEVAPGWRHPWTGRTVRHLAARRARRG